MLDLRLNCESLLILVIQKYFENINELSKIRFNLDINVILN